MDFLPIAHMYTYEVVFTQFLDCSLSPSRSLSRPASCASGMQIYRSSNATTSSNLGARKVVEISFVELDGLTEDEEEDDFKLLLL